MKAKKVTSESTRKPKGRIEINQELCKGCGYCVEACPKSAIVIGKRFNKMGYFVAEVVSDECTGCASCAEMCPEISILVWREK
ncbi:MAG: ferredoxin family protein [Thermodesulfovibrionales bacterium]|nr:ferredoxin family protein [Thermodesulfovibrionales bacterium]